SPVLSRSVQWQDLVLGSDVWIPALYLERVRAAPELGHLRLSVPPAAKAAEHDRADLALVDPVEPWAHEERELGRPGALLLHELVVGGPTAEALRQHVLEDSDELLTEERDAFAR